MILLLCQVFSLFYFLFVDHVNYNLYDVNIVLIFLIISVCMLCDVIILYHASFHY